MSDAAKLQQQVEQLERELAGLADAALADHSRLEDERARLAAQLANAVEERDETLDQLLAAQQDARRDAARASVAELDLRDARRTVAELTARLAAVQAVLEGRRT